MAFQDYFSVVAFFIFLRETLEASVIIAVLLQCMNRTCPRLKKQVWWGAAAGIVSSVIAGGIFAAVYYLAQAHAFQGNGKLIFQGVISYVACILITYLGFAMMRFSNLERKYMRKLDGAARTAMEKAAGKAADDSSGNMAAHKAHGWSVFILAGTAVLREGIESIVFLAGVGSNTSFRALPLACLAGLVVGLAVGFIIYYGGHSIKDLKIFFIISTVVLFFIAAGQVSLGTALLAKVGMYGPYAAWQDELTWQHRPVFDLSSCCSDDFANGNQFFVLARAVVGYQAKPTPVILIMYCAYWVAVITAVVLKWRNGSLFDADYKRKRTLLRLGRRADAADKKAARCTRSIASLEAKLATAAAGSVAAAALTAKLANARAQHARAEATAAEAAAARDAEAARLEAEDAALAAAVAADQALPTTDVSSDAGSSGGSPAAQAIIENVVGAGKAGKDVDGGVQGGGSDTAPLQDVEAAAGGGSGLDLPEQQQQQQGATGWLSRLRRGGRGGGGIVQRQ